MKIRTLIRFFLSLFILSLLCNTSFAHKKTIAITIDDLPFVGDYRNHHLNMILDTLLQQRATATGFIIASEVRKNNWELLNKFRDAGFGLGNHTLSHANLNQLQTQDYLYEIEEADRILAPVLTEPKYFRYPYLAMSNGTKRDEVLCYLMQKNYHVAPITVDSKDFVFNQRLLSVREIDRRTYFDEVLKPFYLEFIWNQTLKAEEHNQVNHQNDQAQILLIHANLLNAYVLPDIIKLYRSHGYKIISLEKALKTFHTVAHCTHPDRKIAPPAAPSLAAKKPTQIAKNHTPTADFDDFMDWD